MFISPKNEDLRSGIIDEMYASALYDGVAHVANTAPEATASLQIAAAQAMAVRSSSVSYTDADDDAVADEPQEGNDGDHRVVHRHE